MSCDKNDCISMVFSMTNELNNRVVAFKRDNMGILSCPKFIEQAEVGQAYGKWIP